MRRVGQWSQRLPCAAQRRHASRGRVLSEGLGSSVLPRDTGRGALPASGTAALPRTTAFMSSDSALSLAGALLTRDESRALACGKRALPEANERALSALGSPDCEGVSCRPVFCDPREPAAAERHRCGRCSAGLPQPCSCLGQARHSHPRLCGVVAVQAHGEAALPAGALHGISFCCLTFELRRPTRQDALGRQQTIYISGCCRPKAACLGGSPLERGVRPHSRR